MVHKTQKQHKKLFVFLMVGLALSTLALATWALSYSSGITGFTIGSEQPGEVAYTDNFEITNINTTNGDVFKNDTIEIVNSNGIFNLTLNVIEFSNDTEILDGCNITGDITSVIKYNNSIVEDGDTLTIASGDSVLVAEITAKKMSCPQNYNIQIDLVN